MIAILAPAITNKHFLTMPRITKRTVDATAGAERDRFIWDTEVKGFGLKVTPAGKRIYIVQFRTGGRGTPTKRVTIGRHGAPWTPEAARGEAKRLLGLVAAGRDPATERRENRAKHAEAAANAFGDLVPVFIERHYRANGLRTAYEVERTLNREAVTRWRRQPVSQIGGKDVAKLLDDTADRAPVLANRLFAYLNQFFEWCVGRHVIEANPMAGLKKPAIERSRDRALDDEEIRIVWQACEEIGWPFGPLVQLLILTGQRRDEVGGMRRSEIDTDKRLWSLPGERTKNRRPHDVPLSDNVLSIIEALPQTAETDLVFTTTGVTAVSGFGVAKRRIDAAVLKFKMGSDDSEVDALAPWKLHDLRRSMATGMAGLGIAPHVVDKILNHTTGVLGGVAGIYNRFEYLEERRVALDAWARHVEQIVGGKEAGAVVVPMVRGT